MEYSAEHGGCLGIWLRNKVSFFLGEHGLNIYEKRDVSCNINLFFVSKKTVFGDISIFHERIPELSDQTSSAIICLVKCVR